MNIQSIISDLEAVESVIHVTENVLKDTGGYRNVEITYYQKDDDVVRSNKFIIWEKDDVAYWYQRIPAIFITDTNRNPIWDEEAFITEYQKSNPDHDIIEFSISRSGDRDIITGLIDDNKAEFLETKRFMVYLKDGIPEFKEIK